MNAADRIATDAAASHRALEGVVATLDDDALRHPSLLAGWTVGHVVAHLARNADSHTGMLVAAARGEEADQYPGGREQREADIDRDAARPAAVALADLRRADADLEAAWTVAAADGWRGRGRRILGPIDVVELPFFRWREVVLHHTDLGLGLAADQWPVAYVREELRRMTMTWNSRLPMGMTGLPAEVCALDEPRRVAWLTGRLVVDGGDPAGLMP